MTQFYCFYGLFPIETNGNQFSQRTRMARQSQATWSSSQKAQVYTKHIGDLDIIGKLTHGLLDK